MNSIQLLSMSAIAVAGVDRVSNFIVKKSISLNNYIVTWDSDFYINKEKAQFIEKITHIASVIIGIIMVVGLQRNFANTHELQQEILRSRATIDELQDHLSTKPKELENKLMKLMKILQTGLDVVNGEEVLGKEWTNQVLSN